MTFLHRFTKILAIKVKIPFCYGLAWPFHFTMSPTTARYVGSVFTEIIYFLPVQSSYELPLGKPSSDQTGGVHFWQPLSVRSWLLLTSANIPYQFALLITRVRIIKSAFHWKKNNNLDQYLLPNPPYTLCCWPILYTPRVTQLLKLHKL